MHNYNEINEPVRELEIERLINQLKNESEKLLCTIRENLLSRLQRVTSTPTPTSNACKEECKQCVTSFGSDLNEILNMVKTTKAIIEDIYVRLEL